MFSFDGMRSLLDTGGKERVFEEEEEEEVEEEVLFKAAMNEVDAGSNAEHLLQEELVSNVFSM